MPFCSRNIHICCLSASNNARRLNAVTADISHASLQSFVSLESSYLLNANDTIDVTLCNLLSSKILKNSSSGTNAISGVLSLRAQAVRQVRLLNPRLQFLDIKTPLNTVFAQFVCGIPKCVISYDVRVKTSGPCRKCRLYKSGHSIYELGIITYILAHLS